MPRTVPPRLKRLHARRKKMQAELLSVDREITRLSREQGVKLSARSKPARPSTTRMLNELTVREAIYALMSKRVRPMHYTDIAETLRKRKLYKTKSPNFPLTVLVTLGKDKRFKKVEPGIYALRGR
jgi:hypothetical protein